MKIKNTKLVGVRRFELLTSRTRTVRASRAALHPDFFQISENKKQKTKIYYLSTNLKNSIPPRLTKVTIPPAIKIPKVIASKA